MLGSMLAVVAPEPRPLDLGLISNTFGSHMVLQRAPKAATIWGHAAAASTAGAAVTVTVTVTFNGVRSAEIFPDASGAWRHTLPPTSADSTGRTITVETSVGQMATLTDVAFGDVYIAGGQSNVSF